MRDDRRESENPFGRHRRRTNGTNGVHPEGLNVRATPLNRYEDVAEPVDLVAVQADDELISALAAGMAVSSPGVGGYSADDQVAAVLAAWKAEVDAEPIPELIDIETAVAAVAAGRPPSRRVRHLAPVAAAAAFIVLAIGGVSVGSYSAQPDDALWGVSKVLYSERAESVEAAARVETRIAKAKDALVAGQPVIAAQELQMAATELATVRPEEGKTELLEVQDFLVAKAAETPPGKPTDPGTPLAAEPTRPVPAGAEIKPPPPDPSSDPAAPTTSPDGVPPAGGPGPDPATLRDPNAQPGPDANPAPTTTPAPTTDPATGVTPTATAEGSQDPTTTPPQSMGQTPSGDAAPTG